MCITDTNWNECIWWIIKFKLLNFNYMLIYELLVLCQFLNSKLKIYESMILFRLNKLHKKS